jgi:hypothetical protein
VHKEAKRLNNLDGELARGSKGLARVPADEKKHPQALASSLG